MRKRRADFSFSANILLTKGVILDQRWRWGAILKRLAA